MGVIWLPYKAQAHEKGKKKPTQERKRYCRICGKPAVIGEYCQECARFLKQKRRNRRD